MLIKPRQLFEVLTLLMKNLFIIILLFLAGVFNNAQTGYNESKTIRVMTFNILHGATTKGDYDLDLLADVILKADPDLVALQEVDFKTNRARKYDLVLELARRTKMVPLFGRAMYYDGGEYGEGILSKKTIIKSRSVSLPYLEGFEPRSALEITVVIGENDTISFIGTHLDHVNEETNRLMQAEKIISVFLTNKYPTILAGDLNDVPGSNTINLLEQVWKLTSGNNPLPTYPSNSPQSKIDYIMVTPSDRWNILETKVIQDSIASDHCAYLSVLELK